MWYVCDVLYAVLYVRVSCFVVRGCGVSLTSAVTFTTDQVTKGISSCSNTRAFGPNKFIIFHIKHLGSRGIEYLTALFNDSSLSMSYRPISLLCPAAKVMEALLLPTINKHLLPSTDQHGFRPGNSTTSAFLQLMSDIATCFNQKKPPYRTVCVAVDLTAAFDTVNDNVLLSNIVRSTLPEATCRWLSNYLRGRQSVTSCICVK